MNGGGEKLCTLSGKSFHILDLDLYYKVSRSNMVIGMLLYLSILFPKASYQKDSSQINAISAGADDRDAHDREAASNGISVVNSPPPHIILWNPHHLMLGHIANESFSPIPQGCGRSHHMMFQS